MTGLRRVRLTFAALVLVAVVAVGGLSKALSAPSSPVAGITVAATGIVAAAAIGLAVRMIVVIDRGRDGDS